MAVNLHLLDYSFVLNTAQVTELPGTNPSLKDSPETTASNHSAAGMLLKRITDFLVSAVLSVILAPLLVIIALAIKLDSPGPALFTQKRIGRHGSLFYIYKFRTMFTGTPDLPTDQMAQMPSRVTRVGDFLRKTSLDELPQLLNILKGEMSLVGPRPALYNQTELTAMRKERGVLSFPPGITGWAQINGRDDLSDTRKVEYDAWYCRNWTYLLDWKIVISTFHAVSSRRGAY